jgi:hypothetical protein
MEKILALLKDYPFLYSYVLRSTDDIKEASASKERSSNENESPTESHSESKLQNTPLNLSKKLSIDEEKNAGKATDHTESFRISCCTSPEQLSEESCSSESCSEENNFLKKLLLENKLIPAELSSIFGNTRQNCEVRLGSSPNIPDSSPTQSLSITTDSDGISMSKISTILFKQVNDTPVHMEESEIISELHDAYVASRIAEIFTPKSDSMFNTHSMWCHRIIENIRCLYECGHYNPKWDFDSYLPPPRYTIDEDIISLWNNFMRRRAQSHSKLATNVEKENSGVAHNSTETSTPEMKSSLIIPVARKLHIPETVKMCSNSNKVSDPWRKTTLYHNVNDYFKIAVASMYALTRSTFTNILNSDLPCQFLKYNDIEKLIYHPLVICLSSIWATKEQQERDEKKKLAEKSHFDDEENYSENQWIDDSAEPIPFGSIIGYLRSSINACETLRRDSDSEHSRGDSLGVGCTAATLQANVGPDSVPKTSMKGEATLQASASPEKMSSGKGNLIEMLANFDVYCNEERKSDLLDEEDILEPVDPPLHDQNLRSGQDSSISHEDVEDMIANFTHEVFSSDEPFSGTFTQAGSSPRNSPTDALEIEPTSQITVTSEENSAGMVSHLKSPAILETIIEENEIPPELPTTSIVSGIQLKSFLTASDFSFRQSQNQSKISADAKT